MEAKIKFLKSISERNRLRILMALITYEELCACQIIELLQFTGATVSRHLALLNQAGIIKSQKKGRWIYFSLKRESLANSFFLDWLFEELKNTKDYLDDCKKLKKIISCDPIILCRKQRGKNCC